MPPVEYRKCRTLGQFFHYTDFVKAGFGWDAPDGSKRHSQSKLGKRVNQCLSNGLRVHVDGELVSIGHTKHPNYDKWKTIEKQIRMENPEYKRPLLRSDLTKEGYIRLYEELGMEIPDLENALYKKNGRGSSNAEKCLDYLNVYTREFKVDKYFVDGVDGNNVYEFLGDYWHANPDLYESTAEIVGYTAEEKWNMDKERAEIIKSHGYNFFVIWESDWTRFSQGTVSKLEIKQW